MILSGIMSMGIKCGRPELPGIYTRVQKFARWIEDIVSGGSGSNKARQHQELRRRKKRSEPKEELLQQQQSQFETVRSYVQARLGSETMMIG